jgi:2-hydroxychromene-2-carboxylate isomerase
MNIKTRLRSLAMRFLSSEGYQQRSQAKGRKVRVRSGVPPTVHYFHQVDDPYSHLAVQKLAALDAVYSVTFQPHLASKPASEFLGSAQHFDQWAIADCDKVCSAYGTEFSPSRDSEHYRLPSQANIDKANAILVACLSDSSFADRAIEVGHLLWSNETIPGEIDNGAATVLTKGNRLRSELGHYQGGMFYFEGEWYWGIDRIRSLEQRLQSEGYRRDDTIVELVVPQPSVESQPAADDVLLEYFPFLRSPYKALGHRRVLEMIERSGVKIKVRPVMPMLMWGIPAPRAKQRYIITDAGREARSNGTPLGKIVDPFGAAVRKAFALFPHADATGHGMAFVTAYLEAAWYKGTDITNEKGLRSVLQDADLDPALIEKARHDDTWTALLEANLQSMLADNLWGVPSFRVSDDHTGQSDFACWGQDRIWRVEQEITNRSVGA